MKKILLTSVAVSLVAMQAFGEPSKSGFIVGVDLGFGLGKGSSMATSAPIGANNGAESTAFFDTKSSVGSGKLVVGYQRYSERLSFLGFNIKAKAGAGMGVMQQIMTQHLNQNNANQPLAGPLEVAYMPLSIGAEVNVLMDFYDNGAHVFGMNAGLGYEFASGAGRQLTFKGAPNEFAPLFNASPLNYQLISPKIGLHYYYENHQFGLDASFDKVLGRTYVAIEVPSGNAQQTTEQKLEVDYNRFCTITLSYAYRF